MQSAIKHLEAEVIVVDNNSSDGSIEYLLPHFKEVTFITCENNIGFGAANNLALKNAKGDFILFLNPDTIVSEHCFTKCIDYLKKNIAIGATGIYMIDGTGNYLPESKRAFPSPLTSLYKLFGLTDLFPKSKVFAKYYLGHLAKTENNEIDVLSGAFMLITKDVALQTKGFDENFFMYGEDIDLSYRIQQLGFKNSYFAETPIIHFKGESTKKNNINYLKTFYTAMEQFVDKHFKSKAFLFLSFFLKIGIWFRAIVALIFSFLKSIAPLLLDAFSLFIAVFANHFFAIHIYQMQFDKWELLITSTCFFVSYVFLNIVNNNYLQQLRLPKLILNIILSVVLLTIISGIYFQSSSLIFIWYQIGAIFLMLRYFIGNKLIKRELLPQYDNIPKHEQLLIVASMPDFQKITNILQQNDLLQVVTGRVAVDIEDDYLSVGNVDDLILVVKNYPVKEIIFVAGEKLSYTKIINLIQLLPKNMNFYFSHTNASAIISSFSKNIVGKVYN